MEVIYIIMGIAIGLAISVAGLAADILAGKTAYVNDTKITGTITSKTAANYIPGMSDQIIAAGQYLSGSQTIKGDTNLVAANIMAGKTIFGVTGTGIGLSSVGNVTRTHYVYKGQTVRAGDFIKIVTGIAGVATSATASVQTSSVLAPHAYIPNNCKFYGGGLAPRIKCISPTKVIRSWMTCQNTTQQYHMSQIGTVTATSSPNVVWGTAKQTGSGVALDCSPFPEDFERIADDGSYYVGVLGMPSSTTAEGIKVSVYKADDTTMKSDVTCALTRSYDGMVIVNGIKYIGNGKCLVIASAQVSSDKWSIYGVVITYDSSANTISFGTVLSIKTINATSRTCLNAVDIFIAEVSNTIVVGLYGEIYRLRVTGTTVTTVTTRSASAVTAWAYEPDSDLIIGMHNQYLEHSSGYSTLRYVFCPYMFDGNTMTIGTAVSCNLKIPTSKVGCSSSSSQHKAVRLESNTYYLICSRINWGGTSWDSTIFYPLTRLIFTYIDGTFTITSYQHEDNSTASFHTCELMENSMKVVEMYGWASVEAYTGNKNMYDVIKDGSNATISDLNYVYETQVALADGNSDIEGIAITSGTGGSATVHNQQVTIRTNV